MTQRELIKELSDRTGVSNKDVRQILSELTSIVQDELSKEGVVKVQGLGVFKTKRRAAKKVKLKGNTYQLPERNVPFLQFSAKLQETVAKTK